MITKSDCTVVFLAASLDGMIHSSVPGGFSRDSAGANATDKQTNNVSQLV